ncbi:MAG: MerR family transcriptional regulator [Alphaproteobacteria bacterium]|nr:MerR family transcriptional regulator [Alphaproteobacteria bacterium]
MVINKSKSAFRTIAEVADKLGVGTHVLRFWESKFSQLKPIKMSGGRRYYRPDDVKLLECIQHLLHEERYTIEGVQKLFKEKGTKFFVGDTIQEDFFEKEEDQPVISENSSLIDSEKLSNIIAELKDIKQNLQKNMF